MNSGIEKVNQAAQAKSWERDNSGEANIPGVKEKLFRYLLKTMRQTLFKGDYNSVVEERDRSNGLRRARKTGTLLEGESAAAGCFCQMQTRWPRPALALQQRCPIADHPGGRAAELLVRRACSRCAPRCQVRLPGELVKLGSHV